MSEPIYTQEHVDAAMCMWQHVLRELRRHRERGNPWADYIEGYGEDVLRATVARHAPLLETAYREALANNYHKDFASDFVPKYMEDHVARILT